MLTLNASEDKQTTCFKLLGAKSSSEQTHLISDNTSLLSNASGDSCLDSCSFYSGPSDSSIIAFCESAEGMSFASVSGESCGSIAFAGTSGESCGSIASSGFSSSFSSSSSGGGCSYSC